MFQKVGKGALARRGVAAIVAVILMSTAVPVFAEEATSTPSCPDCILKDQKLQSLEQHVSQLETETAQLRLENLRIRRASVLQGRRINVLRTRYLRSVRQVRALVRRIALMFGPWKTARVSWYGPGFYGRGMAGGGVLRPGMKVFAHRTMKFGTKVQFSYKGRTVVAVARDRGPYVSGREFDLGPGTASALRFNGVGTVKWRVVRG
ncbi:MAG: hypothetical protein C4521_01180 [Actinobacteria bacterium]|nr:MAG: hypothetical protein C4521_01180 [Actinomycetota bacterium]